MREQVERPQPCYRLDCAFIHPRAELCTALKKTAESEAMEHCPFFKTKKQQEESLEKARKRNGYRRKGED